MMKRDLVYGALAGAAVARAAGGRQLRGVNTTTKSISLSPSEEACPVVEIDKHEVRIGETGNLAKLTPGEWNVLVRAIRAHALLEL